MKKLLPILSLAFFSLLWSTTTTNMGLDLPQPGVTAGPQWATKLNTALTTVDSHNHTTGKGARIPTAGLNINDDVAFNGYNLNNANSYRMSSLSATLSGASDLRSLYSVSGDLYYNNASGVAVKLTSGSGLNIASLGTIGGDYGGSNPASLFYTNSTKTFSFTQSTGITAKVAFGDISLFENVSGAQSVTIKSPTSLGSSYTLTLPTATPGASTVMKSTTGGALSFGTVGSAEITDASITGSDIAAATITGSNLVTNTVGNSQIRQSAALSVVGNSTNSTANVADMTAASDGQVLRRSGTAVGFGTVATAGITDAAVTTVKIADANVTTSKITDANVTRAKLDSDAKQGLARAFISFSAVSAAGLSYSQTGTTVTITQTAHGKVVGQGVLLDFTSGTGTDNDGYYLVATTPDANTFTVTVTNSHSTSGLVSNTVWVKSAYNISSISRGGTGNHTITFSSAFSDTNYIATGTVRDDDGTGSPMVFTFDPSDTKSTTQLQFRARSGGGNTLIDCPEVNVVVYSL